MIHNTIVLLLSLCIKTTKEILTQSEPEPLLTMSKEELLKPKLTQTSTKKVWASQRLKHQKSWCENSGWFWQMNCRRQQEKFGLSVNLNPLISQISSDISVAQWAYLCKNSLQALPTCEPSFTHLKMMATNLLRCDIPSNLIWATEYVISFHVRDFTFIRHMLQASPKEGRRIHSCCT